MTPVICGRTSEVVTADVRPGSSVMRCTVVGRIVMTPTSGGRAAAFAAGARSQPATRTVAGAIEARMAARRTLRRLTRIFDIASPRGSPGRADLSDADRGREGLRGTGVGNGSCDLRHPASDHLRWWVRALPRLALS